MRTPAVEMLRNKTTSICIALFYKNKKKHMIKNEHQGWMAEKKQRLHCFFLGMGFFN